MERKVTVIPVVICELGLISESDNFEIKERVQIIQATALLKSVRILR